MTRRGRCRCGAILTFEPSPAGYKTKCERCGAVVRLRDDGPIAALPPDGPGSVALVETTPYFGPLAPDDAAAYEEPKRPTRRWPWAVAAGVVAAAVLWGVWRWVG